MGVWKDGILVQASTRGDGKIGEEVTANVKTIEAIPLKLRGNNEKGEIEIRGEIFMAKDTFEKLNKAGQTIVMVSHDERIAQRAGRVVMLADGKISRTWKGVLYSVNAGTT